MRTSGNKNKSILFLGYGEEQTSIISELRAKGYEVLQKSEKVEGIQDQFDLVLSFGYRHILTETLINDT